MEPTSLTVKILEQIRDSIGQTNAKLEESRVEIGQKFDRLTDQVDTLTDRVDTLTNRVDTLTDRVDTLTNRVVEGEVRSATAIMDLAGTLHDVKTLLQGRRDLRKRVERCEHDIVVLKERSGIK